jgi:hydrogenase maturation protease
MLRVIGIGSPHGDDQIGWRLIEELADLESTDLSLCSVPTPIDMLERLGGCDVLIVVDACDVGKPPGSVVVREWPALLESEGHASSHGLGVDSVLRLAENLGRLPRRVILFGVQKSRSEHPGDLSADVSHAWPQIIRQLTALIDGLAHRE